MVADISPEVLFIVHAGDSAVITLTMESYFPPLDCLHTLAISLCLVLYTDPYSRIAPRTARGEGGSRNLGPLFVNL